MEKYGFKDENFHDELKSDRPNKQGLTNYDLPLEYNEDMLNEYIDRAENTHRVTLANDIRQARSILFAKVKSRETNHQMALNRKSVFGDLDNDILLSIILGRKRFDFVLEAALELVESNAIRIFQIWFKLFQCAAGEYNETIEIPHNAFSWNFEDYLKRRKLDNITWTNLLEKELPENCLNLMKLQHDVEELLNSLKKIFNGFRRKRRVSFDVEEEIVVTLRKQLDFVHFYETLEKNLKSNKLILQESVNRHKLLIINMNTDRDKRNNLEEVLTNSDVFNPIETRYQLQYAMNKVQQTEYKYENSEQNILDQIEKYHYCTNMEKYCSQCILNMYYSEIERFKSKITLYNDKYDAEYEKRDNEYSYMKLTIDKLRDQHKFCLSEIIRFNAEIEAMLIAEEAKRIEEEEKHLAHLEQERLKQLKKDAKKKKKEKSGKK